MKLQKINASDLSEDVRTLQDPGIYCLSVKKCELKVAKSTQAMLSLQYGVCSKDRDPDSVVGSPIFGFCMLPFWEDDATFADSVAEKFEAKNGSPPEDLSAVIDQRKAQSENGAAQFAFAVFGYEDFPPVPRYNWEEKKFYMPDGSVFKGSDSDRQALYDARTAAGVNAIVDIANGEKDITRYSVYAEVAVEEYRGEKKNSVKNVKAFLKPTDKVCFPKV